jgi:superfamily I DNA and/or RNA helicase
VTLDEQYRMHPRLGEFVSQEFYPPEERFKSPKPASEFLHSIRGLEGRCAHWHDVPFAQRGESRDGTSWKRVAEAREIAQLLRMMLDDDGARSLNFGVITFYRAQVHEIQRALVEAEVMIPSESGAEFPDAYADRVRIGTVDQFQGREFDVVLLSLVRSNQQRDGTEEEQRRRYGHLMSVNRLCVSMSRQKRMLVVVGDAEMVASDGARRAIPQLVAFKALAESDAAEVGGGAHV